LARPRNLVRIIGGEYRGRRLSFTPATGLRPTPERVRETLFNWLRDDIRGAHCLDLFAGSGALGFEALSRGAATVTAVERNRAVAQRLRDNASLVGAADRMAVVPSDAARFLKMPPARPYDIVFLDPPFAERRHDDVLDVLQQAAWLSEHAVVYQERDQAHPWGACPSGWRVDRESRAGQTVQRLLRRSSEVEIIDG
jgi:16S rRNA (guanine966-N2)-methyltransferase